MVDAKSSRWGSKPKTAMQLRFERVLELLGVPQREFVKLPGVTPQNLYSAYRREKVGEAHIARLRELASLKGLEGLTIDWLETGLGEEPRLSGREVAVAGILDPRSALRSQPVGQVRPSSLESRYVRFDPLEGYTDEPTHPVDILSSLLRQNAALLSPAVRVFTNATDVMRGEIEKGDLVFVDTSIREVTGDGVYAYKIGGIPQMRRIQVRGKGVLRFRGTHAYEDSLELSGAELADLEIGGRVIGSIGSRNF